ncbi:hypothetical protein NUU61_002349 [Penicillium alfredii]|uniref:Uncharacterized protein n=1 Tax=Penicillium alfredii TaxID=1506179 RepID=A0A9W9KH83_9EURO|nr:uncharacterized protein NUU61_002349 [Penicillium alfredii]KAJ5105002.1 hypothetical protein NUU61_002349 [Penicillium alfredii]
MQYKSLAAVLFFTTALAAPAADSRESTSDDSGDSPSGYTNDMYTINVPEVSSPPSSIISALGTAIPASWILDMQNEKYYRSEMKNYIDGTMPAWYSTLPSSVKEYFTSVASDEISALFSATPTSTPESSSDSSSDSKGASSTTGVSSTGAPSSSVTSSGSLSGSSSSASATSTTTTSASASSSKAPESSSSTGGAPAATGAVAASLAGAAGILGLALAL